PGGARWPRSPRVRSEHPGAAAAAGRAAAPARPAAAGGPGVRARGRPAARLLARDVPGAHAPAGRVPVTARGRPGPGLAGPGGAASVAGRPGPGACRRAAGEGSVMRAARYGLIGILAALLGACRAAAPPLPPIPANSGGVMVRAGEAPPVRDGQAVIDRVVAVVNDEVIMMSELQEAVILYQREARGAPEGPDLERTVLNRLVDHRLQVQEAR